MNTSTGDKSFEAVVIGAGAGGMAAAALLVHYGYRTLLVEAKSQVGGRASTVQIEGFGVNTGAQIFELGGANGALFDEVGVSIRARKQTQPIVLRLGSLDIPVISGPTGLLINKIVIPVVGGAARRFGVFRPAEGLNVAQWLDRLHAPNRLRKLGRNLTSAFFAAEPQDVSATLFFDYLTKKGGISTYGAHPEGSIGPWRDLARYIERAGGTIWLDSEVTGIRVGTDGRADGVTVHRDGGEVTVATGMVVSNVGPVATAKLVPVEAQPAQYVEKLEAENYPGTLITVNFATDKPIARLKTLVIFGFTDRLAYASYMSGPSPELAPPGWHLYCATSTPHPASTGFDVDAEIELLKRETLQQFPEFANARILSIAVCTGDWPGQRAIPGRDWPNHTPVENIWNVGDGARPWLGSGQSGCVESARLVVDAIREQRPVNHSVEVLSHKRDLGRVNDRDYVVDPGT
ncbi:phytoene desaturase family protein [Mycobacterium vicinigordonae]|uniref:phytoene desaturase family protein n=1 Tax=Mycobacterium vicinigordonae TaxID=1719132 RepID=UPI001FE509F4|nr:FAD-dependent oxidoreductase [Mycobacterium vicinigordonae]